MAENTKTHEFCFINSQNLAENIIIRQCVRFEKLAIAGGRTEFYIPLQCLIPKFFNAYSIMIKILLEIVPQNLFRKEISFIFTAKIFSD